MRKVKNASKVKLRLLSRVRVILHGNTLYVASESETKESTHSMLCVEEGFEWGDVECGYLIKTSSNNTTLFFRKRGEHVIDYELSNNINAFHGLKNLTPNCVVGVSLF